MKFHKHIIIRFEVQMKDKLLKILESPMLINSFRTNLLRYDDIEKAIWYTLRDSETDLALLQSGVTHEVECKECGWKGVNDQTILLSPANEADYSICPQCKSRQLFDL